MAARDLLVFVLLLAGGAQQAKQDLPLLRLHWSPVKFADGGRLPEERRSPHCFTHEGKLYMIGGWREKPDQQFEDFELSDAGVFDPATRRWRTQKLEGDVPPQGSRVAYLTSSAGIFAVGESVWRLDLKSWSWQKSDHGKQRPEPERLRHLAADEKHLYALGPGGNLWIYGIGAGQWETVEKAEGWPELDDTWHGGAIVDGDTLWVVSTSRKEDRTSVLGDRTWRFSLKDRTWKEAAPGGAMTFRSTESFVEGTKLYLLASYGERYRQLVVFDAREGRWSARYAWLGDLPCRFGGGFWILNGRAYVAGGLATSREWLWDFYQADLGKAVKAADRPPSAAWLQPGASFRLRAESSVAVALLAVGVEDADGPMVDLKVKADFSVTVRGADSEDLLGSVLEIVPNAYEIDVGKSKATFKDGNLDAPDGWKAPTGKFRLYVHGDGIVTDLSHASDQTGFLAMMLIGPLIVRGHTLTGWGGTLPGVQAADGLEWESTSWILLAKDDGFPMTSRHKLSKEEDGSYLIEVTPAVDRKKTPYAWAAECEEQGHGIVRLDEKARPVKIEVAWSATSAADQPIMSVTSRLEFVWK